MSELQSQHEKWKAARARLDGPQQSNIVAIVPPTPDPAADTMDIIIAAVANSTGVPIAEIVRGVGADSLSARRLAAAMCVRHPRFSAERVADHFEISETVVQRALSVLDPILDSYAITRKTPLELSLPLIAKEWNTVAGVHRRRPSMEAIVTAVSEVFNESRDDILSDRRAGKDLIRSRHVSVALCKHLTLFSMGQIGKFFNRDHTTVLHSVRKFAPIYEILRTKVSPAGTPEAWATAAWDQMQSTSLADCK